jgi:hypothetical protein
MEEAPRVTEFERAQQIVNIITETIEPEAWEVNGGSYATIRYYQGTLIVRAPDFIQRQIGGYPFAIRPGAGARVAADASSRYVMFTGGASNVSLSGFRSSRPVGGTTGTSSSGSGSGATESVSGGSSASAPKASDSKPSSGQPSEGRTSGAGGGAESKP